MRGKVKRMLGVVVVSLTLLVVGVGSASATEIPCVSQCATTMGGQHVAECANTMVRGVSTCAQ